MKRIAVFLALALMLPPSGRAADSGRCYSSRDADLKNQCLAITRQDKSRCYAIRDSDMKNACLAELGNDRSRCYSIRDRDRRQGCLARFQGGGAWNRFPACRGIAP